MDEHIEVAVLIIPGVNRADRIAEPAAGHSSSMCIHF
jgi:hypothetical protein